MHHSLVHGIVLATYGSFPLGIARGATACGERVGRVVGPYFMRRVAAELDGLLSIAMCTCEVG